MRGGEREGGLNIIKSTGPKLWELNEGSQYGERKGIMEFLKNQEQGRIGKTYFAVN